MPSFRLWKEVLANKVQIEAWKTLFAIEPKDPLTPALSPSGGEEKVRGVDERFHNLATKDGRTYRAVKGWNRTSGASWSSGGTWKTWPLP